MYYKGPHFLNTGKADYDTVFKVSAAADVRCDRSSFKGTVTGISGVRVGDILLTEKENDEEKNLNNGINKQYPLGFVTAVSGNTVTLQNMGMGIRDGQYSVWVSRLR